MPSCLDNESFLALKFLCQFLKPFEYAVLDYVIIAHVLDPRYKLDHLKATLIEVSKYSSNVEETLNIEEPSNVENVEIDSIEYKLELYKNEPLEDRMAHNYLSIQPLSISSERVFSRAGFTLTSDRANLSENTVSSMILMYSWLKKRQNEISPFSNLL
ncbi:29529_t:CDS:2 [Gigaspora margarita]|uniref:29529_t:CDS:1 n=1 Tax=Gigaspora margarita TaxID=4874 RepID=A0ABN7VPW0_GIGMA|nr:29529_t:CDS:2 [Gigaspora margarita]